MNDIRYKTIIEEHGYDSQSRQLIEEMSELTQAINKFWRYSLKKDANNFESVKNNDDAIMKNIVEEIADVQVCLNQMIIMFDCKDEVNKAINFKLDREISKINGKMEE